MGKNLYFALLRHPLVRKAISVQSFHFYLSVVFFSATFVIHSNCRIHFHVQWVHSTMFAVLPRPFYLLSKTIVILAIFVTVQRKQRKKVEIYCYRNANTSPLAYSQNQYSSYTKWPIRLKRPKRLLQSACLKSIYLWIVLALWITTTGCDCCRLLFFYRSLLSRACTFFLVEKKGAWSFQHYLHEYGECVYI